MISFNYFVLAFCLACAAAVEQVQEEGTTFPPPPEDVAHRELTDAGYIIRHGDSVYGYPVSIVPVVRLMRTEGKNPTETNEIEIEIEEDQRRPLFYFTTYEDSDKPAARQSLPVSRPFIEIRRKRDLENVEVPESSKVGKLRRKRTYCGRCGGGRKGGGYYVPVVYTVYPVYYGGGGGGGKGCYTCGGGGGGGGGFGGSYSYSSSSAHSSSGSFGWGKK